jgi:hypothetical protein
MPNSPTLQSEIEVTHAMIEAGVEWFEQNNEGRFPFDWPIARLFVSGLLSAALNARGARRDIPEAA